MAASSNDTSCFRLLLWLLRASSRTSIMYIQYITFPARIEKRPGRTRRELRRQASPTSKLEPIAARWKGPRCRVTRRCSNLIEYSLEPLRQLFG